MDDSLHNQNSFDLIWGAAAIAAELSIKPRKAFYLLESGQLPARKIAGRWVVERARLRAFFLATGKAA